MEKVIFILRGPAGCGKSTYIKSRLPADSVICSADHFFYKNNHITGEVEYKFDPTKISQAHSVCRTKAIRAMRDGATHIVIDNTNTELWEYADYVELAHLVGYRIQVIVFNVTEIETIRHCVHNSVHEVPYEVVMRMAYNFEKYTVNPVQMVEVPH